MSENRFSAGSLKADSTVWITYRSSDKAQLVMFEGKNARANAHQMADILNRSADYVTGDLPEREWMVDWDSGGTASIRFHSTGRVWAHFVDAEDYETFQKLRGQASWFWLLEPSEESDSRP